MNDRALELYLQQLRMRHMSRRRFLSTTATIGAAAVIAACAPAPTATPVPPTAAPPPTAPPQPTSPPQPTASPAPQLENELFLYNWPDYVSPDNIKNFENQFGVKVILDSYPSNEDLLAKVEAGGTGYDVVVPTDYMVQIMAEKGLLLELDYSLLSNAKYLGEKFRDVPFDPGHKVSLPKTWGTTGVMWRTDVIKPEEEPQSWADFWELAKKYSGRITVVDSSPDVIGAALKLLGYPLNDTDPAHLDQALQKLLELKPHLKAFESGYMPLLASGEIVAALGWSTDAMKVRNEGAPVKYIVPNEGSLIWMDNWCILKTAPHPKAAHAWINFVYDPQVSAQESNYIAAPSPIPEAEKYIKPDLLNNPAIYPPPEIIAKLEAVAVLDADALQRREELWTKLKSA